MSIVKNFKINDIDASINLASETESGLMSSDNYTELKDLSVNKVSVSNDSETTISDISDSFNITDWYGNNALSIDDTGTSVHNIIIKDTSSNVLQTFDENITNETSESLYVTDGTGNVALKIDSSGVSYYGKVNKSDIPSSVNSNSITTNNYFPADINLCITFGQSNSLNGNNPTPKYDFENALIFKGSEGTGRLYFSGGIIDDKTDNELEAVFGGGFTSLQDYTSSLYTLGGGIYEYMKTLKEENNIEDYESLGFQFLGVTCGQVESIYTLTNTTDVYYKRILTCVSYAKKYANALGKSFSVPYLTYIEGEYDASSDEKYFHDMLWVFFSNIENDIKTITGQDNNIVFMTYQQGKFVGSVNDTNIYHGSSMALVSLSVETGDGTGYTLDDTAQTYLQEGVSLIDRSKIHFSCPFYFLASEKDYTEGNTTLPIHLSWTNGVFNIFGAYQGLQAKRCLTDGNPVPTLYPISHNIIDSSDGTYTITVEFEVPVPPLQFKQYDGSLGNYASQTVQDDGYEPNYGFQLTATEYSNVFEDIITSVKIKRRKYVEIKTSSDPTGLYLTYAHKGWLSGGNLCDSQGNYNQVEVGSNTFPLDNWCPVFDYLLN